MKPQIILATTNSSKIEPFLYSWNKNKLSDKYELLTFKDITNKPNFEVEEDTNSFELDALKKAMEYAKFLQIPTISIDRGIEIPSLNNWPGTHSKEIFEGLVDETKVLMKDNLESKQNHINISQYVLDKIKDENRVVNSVYGIAIALPDGKYTSDQVKFSGKASENLVITDIGWNYDWFYIPNNIKTTLSNFTEKEYIEFTGIYLWPITSKIIDFLNQNIN